MLEKIKVTYKSEQKSTGFVPRDLQSKASRGDTFYGLVLDAVNENRINYPDAANALGLRVNSLVNEI